MNPPDYKSLAKALADALEAMSVYYKDHKITAVLYKQVEAALAAYCAAVAADTSDSRPWIPVTERLPEKFETVELQSKPDLTGWLAMSGKPPIWDWQEPIIVAWRPLKEDK
jgi:hypothetical protein